MVLSAATFEPMSSKEAVTMALNSAILSGEDIVEERPHLDPSTFSLNMRPRIPFRSPF
jgi:hypothetical protein